LSIFAIRIPLIQKPDFDLKQVISENRLTGLWRLLVGYRLHYMLANLSLGVSAVSKMATLLLLRYFVDEVLLRPNTILLHMLPTNSQLTSSAALAELTSPTLPVSSVPLQTLLLIGLGFVVLAALEGGFTFFSGRLAAMAAEGIAYRLRNYMFDHIQRLSFRYHDKNQTGDLLQRSTSDVDAVRRFFVDQGVGIGRIVLLFLVNFIGISIISFPLALFSSLVIPVVVLVSLFFFKKVSDRYEEYQNQEAVVSTRLQENLTGVRVVKAFARQGYEIDKFEEANFQLFLRGRAELIMHSFFWPVTDLLTGIQLLSAYFLAATLVIDRQLSVGDYLAFAGMIIYIIFPMRNMGRIIVQMSAGLVSYDRIRDVIQQTREPLGEGEPGPIREISGEVVFEQVNFEYDEEMPVLKDVSFVAEPGKYIALMGATGSGKTSVVNLLLRFYDYQSGSIRLDGIELTEYPRDFLRRNIGIVEQEPFLFSRSIRENITYGVGREVSDEEVEAAAKAAAIHHVILTFPEGYGTLVGERGVTLSGGQKQRIAVARTLLKNPRILIMDDATSSVDVETEAAIRTALKQLMPGRTTFIIAHRIQTVMNADLILVFEDGEIVQRGTHEELLLQEGSFYQRIFDMQSRIDAELEKELSLE
jgi:ATP-binding cassette, subfamily B, bacterial